MKPESGVSPDGDLRNQVMLGTGTPTAMHWKVLVAMSRGDTPTSGTRGSRGEEGGRERGEGGGMDEVQQERETSYLEQQLALSG